MFLPHMINQVVDWERRLEIEEENRKNRRQNEPYTNYLTPVPPCQRARRSILDRLFSRERHPACPCYMQDTCPKTQPG